jgi:hypothetical protein
MPTYNYIRINANGETPMEFVNLADTVPKDEVWNELKQTLSHYSPTGAKIYFGTTKYSLWCSDGKRYNVEISYDDEGLNKSLLPNHRMNAMVDLGRFTNKNFNYIGNTNNQGVKETWGSNYFVGDVIVKVVEGKPIPDISIFGDNPIASILKRRQPNNRMISKYGLEKATKMTHALYAKIVPDGMVTQDSWDNAEWEMKDYHIIPKSGADDEYLELLDSWGVIVG